MSLLFYDGYCVIELDEGVTKATVSVIESIKNPGLECWGVGWHCGSNTFTLTDERERAGHSRSLVKEKESVFSSLLAA